MNGVLQFGNIFAPPWMGHTPIVQDQNDWEWEPDIVPVNVPGASFVNGTLLPIDADADYLVREVQFAVTAVTVNGVPSGVATPTDIRVRIRDGQGRLFTSDFVPISDLNGPICPPWPLRRGSVLVIDFQNTNTTANEVATVRMLLKGWKRNPCPGLAEFLPPYKPLYRQYPDPLPGTELDDFEYPFTFTNTGAGDLLKQPLVTDNDADFWWCGIAGDWNTANNDVQAVGALAVTFYDTVGLPLMQNPLTNPWGSTAAGLFRESVFSSGGGRPAPFYPAIFIPRGGVVLVDVSFGSAQTLRFSLRGKKVYGACQ